MLNSFRASSVTPVVFLKETEEETWVRGSTDGFTDYWHFTALKVKMQTKSRLNAVKLFTWPVSVVPSCAASSFPVDPIGPTAEPSPLCCARCTCCPRSALLPLLLPGLQSSSAGCASPESLGAYAVHTQAHFSKKGTHFMSYILDNFPLWWTIKFYYLAQNPVGGMLSYNFCMCTKCALYLGGLQLWLQGTRLFHHAWPNIITNWY